MPLSADIQDALKRRGPVAIVLYALEAFGLLLVFGFLKILPLDAASALGGFIGRTLGPLMNGHKRALAHVARALPALNPAERNNLVREMWDNLGRTMAEYPHLGAMRDLKRVTVEGIEHLNAMRDDGKPGIIVGGHTGNWEITGVVTQALGVPIAVVYRNPNNPFVGAMLEWARRAVAPYRMPKGPQGGRALARHLRKGGDIGMLVDQKLNEGLELKLFNMPAMTAESPAVWGLRMDLPLTGVYTYRIKGARFGIRFEKIEKPAGYSPENVAALSQSINDWIERHIRQHPAQWLWVHRRWKD